MPYQPPEYPALVGCMAFLGLTILVTIGILALLALTTLLTNSF